MTDDDEQTRRDTSYSPASETEQREAQKDPDAGVRPGAGGPDDPGQADAAEAAEGINRPRDTGAH
jgi:hypothetical protein